MLITMFQQLKTEKILEILEKDELTEIIENCFGKFCKFVLRNMYEYINFSLNLQPKIVILNGIWIQNCLTSYDKPGWFWG